MLRIRSRDSGNSAQLTHAVGREQRANTSGSGVPVGSIRTVQLIAVADPADVRVRLNLLQKLEIEVTGDAEDVANADLFQTREQKLANRDGWFAIFCVHAARSTLAD